MAEDRDQDAFVAALDNDDCARVAGLVRNRTGPRALRRRSLDGPTSTGPGETHGRLNAFTRTPREQLKFVVIDVEPGDNAQVIFETLNHRGVPLLAADLIKNLVFQVADHRGRVVKALYGRYWKDLDGDHWVTRKERRQYVPRVDIFVNYWLVMRLLREVPSDRIFADFRDRLVPDVEDVETLLSELSRDATNFAALDVLPEDSPEGRFLIPGDARAGRRCRHPLPAVAAALGRVDTCTGSEGEGPRGGGELARPPRAVPTHRRRHQPDGGGSPRSGIEHRTRDRRGRDRGIPRQQTAASRLWPSDDYVAAQLADMTVYTSSLRARLRMVLEALEDRRRTEMAESGSCPRGLTVEHVMPRGWREHWNEEPLDPVVAARRDALVHTLGNLTLVNSKLNPSLSNRPWTNAVTEARRVGDKGKRALLLEHSTLKTNADIVAKNSENRGLSARSAPAPTR